MMFFKKLKPDTDKVDSDRKPDTDKVHFDHKPKINLDLVKKYEGYVKDDIENAKNARNEMPRVGISHSTGGLKFLVCGESVKVPIKYIVSIEIDHSGCAPRINHTRRVIAFTQYDCSNAYPSSPAVININTSDQRTTRIECNRHIVDELHKDLVDAWTGMWGRAV